MSDLQTVYYDDYSGGLNDTSSDREIFRDQASVLKNWDIKYQGQLRRRNGITQVGNTIGSNPILSLGNFRQSNAAKDILCFENSTLRYLNGATWDALDDTFVAGRALGFENIMAHDKIFMANEDNELRYWDRSSVILDACLILVANAPHGNIMRWHKNHLFHLNNVVVDTTRYPHDLFWSNLGDPTNYDTATNHFTVPGNGRLLSAMDQGDALVLFKEKSIQYLMGWGSASWQVTESSANVANLDEQVGIAGPLACTRVGNEVWFMDDRGQIRRIYQTDTDAFRKDIISKNIQGTLAAMNKTVLSKVCMWTHDDKVFVAIPTNTSIVPNLIMVFDILAANRTNREAWTTYTGWTPNVFSSFSTSTTPDLYLGDATTGKVFVHSGISDNGVAIDADWQGKNDNFKAPERYKTYKFGYLSGQATGSAKIDTYSAVDSGSFAKLDALDLSGSGSRLGPTGSFFLGPTGDARLAGSSLRQGKFFYQTGGGQVVGRMLKHRIRHTTLNEQPIVNGHSSHFRPRLLR